MKLIFAADHGGLALKTILVALAKSLGHEVSDLGTHDGASVDYPDFAKRAAEGLLAGVAARAILCCGSGVGMAIAANRHKGIRAVNCSDVYTASMSRKHNDANVLALGGRVVGEGLASEILQSWLATEFEAGRHASRIAKLDP
jgi:ribose 5-phosphate isomerase B